MNTANLLSLSRLLLAPFILVFFSRKNLYGVIVIWALAALTDFLDGRMARKLGEISELGKILDPLADKMTLACSFIALMIWYELPDWLGVIYITKELLQLSGGLFFFKKKQKVIPSNYWGKASTFVFFVGLFVLLYRCATGRGHSLLRPRPFVDCFLYLLPECFKKNQEKPYKFLQSNFFLGRKMALCHFLFLWGYNKPMFFGEEEIRCWFHFFWSQFCRGSYG